MANIRYAIWMTSAYLCTVGVAGRDIQGLYGPRCITCSGALDPSECRRTVECWASERCYTKRYMHEDGQVLYDFGCKIMDECALIAQSSGRKKRLHISIDLCEECCDGDLCNVNTCVNGTSPRMLPCYSCQHEGNPHDCHTVTHCSGGEMCYAEMVLTDSPHPLHTMSCLTEQVCHVLESGALSLVGRRSDEVRRVKRDTHLCQKCCSTPGCNVDLCDTSEVTTRQDYSRSTPTTSNPTTHLLQCGAGTIGFRDSCYIINPDNRVPSFDAAKSECHKLGAKLVSIDSTEEVKFLTDQLKSQTNSSWGWQTDGQRINGTWVWTETGLPVDMTLITWGDNEPYGDNDNCLSFYRDKQFKFADVLCSFREDRNFICETPLR